MGTTRVNAEKEAFLEKLQIQFNNIIRFLRSRVLEHFSRLTA